jgi:glycosyltransferase involved in cell wall biosynthesis
VTVLGVDGMRLVRQRSGVALAIEAFLNTLVQIPDQPFDDIRLYTPEPIDPAVRLPDQVRVMVVPSPLPPMLWQQLVLPWVHGRSGVLLCPSYVLPVLAACPTLLMHHGSYEGYAQAAEVFSWWRRLKYRISYPISARRASIVSTVSHHSRRDMAKFYRMPLEKIEVVPEGADTTLFRPIDDEQQLAAWRQRVIGADVPFLLYVGKPTKRRNLPNVLRAFARLKREDGLPHRLVLIGSALPGTSFDALAEELSIKADIVTVPYASHAEIAVAYNAASVVLYPSSYEGFGMPVLEAMACGAPLIALNNTSIPEIAGGIAMLLEDAEVPTLIGGIRRALADDAWRARMRTEGPKRAAAFDWRIVTAQYLALLRRLLPPESGRR